MFKPLVTFVKGILSVFGLIGLTIVYWISPQFRDNFCTDKSNEGLDIK